MIEERSSESELQQRQRFVSDVFHTLNQPLTALHCSLELALRKRMTPADYRSAIQNALESTERLMQATSLVRQMAEADDPGQPEIINLSGLLHEIIEDFAPVAESQEVGMESRLADALPVLADAQRLRKCLFYLLDFSLQSSMPRSTLRVEAACAEDIASVRIRVATDARPSTTAGLHGMELSSRTLKALGGSFSIGTEDADLTLSMTLPLRA